MSNLLSTPLKALMLVGGLCALAALLTTPRGNRPSEQIWRVPNSALISDRYLSLLASALTGILYRRDSLQRGGEGSQEELGRSPFNLQIAYNGDDWPSIGHTMVGCRRLANIRALLESGQAGNNANGRP
jgi:hypothetical protein